MATETAQRVGEYPSNLTDEQWNVIRDCIPEPVWLPNLQEPRHDRRRLVDGILYVMRTGCQWRALPNDFPPWKTVFNYYAKWNKDGTLQRVHDRLRDSIRTAEGRSTSPTLGILDSQSAKTTEVALDRGFDAGKKVKSRKRHVLVDVLGLVLCVLVTSASIQDRDGAVPVLRSAAASYPTLKKVLVDGAYTGDRIASTSAQTNIEVEMVKRSDVAKGFVPVHKRWIGERTFGWLGRWRRTSKDYERYASTEECVIRWSMVGLMVRRLA
jgi:putative transposase